MKTIPKKNLKENYYYESKPWYDTMPNKLPIVDYTTVIFPRTMSHREILKEYNIEPYTVQEAFSVAADLVKKLKNNDWRLVYFTDNDTLYRFDAWRDVVGQLRVGVNEVGLDGGYGAGGGACLRSKSLSSSPSVSLASGLSVSLPDELLINGIKYKKS